MKKIIPLILALCFVMCPVTANGASAKITPGRTIWTVYSNKATITGRVSYAGGQLVVLYNAKGKPVDYQKMPNTGRAADFSLSTSKLTKGKSAIFYIKSLKSKNVGKSGSRAIVVTYTDPVTGTRGAQAAVKWAVKIANDNSFNYGNRPAAARLGCYFCKTNGAKVNMTGDKRYYKTYVCMTFVHAAYAHGAKDPEMLKDCKARKTCIGLTDWNFKHYHCWKKIGLCSKLKVKDLKPGDVIIWWADDDYSGHASMYIGNNSIVDAGKLGFGADTIAVRKNSAQSYLNRGARHDRRSYVMRYIGPYKK